jgi:hypothetical protein
MLQTIIKFKNIMKYELHSGMSVHVCARAHTYTHTQNFPVILDSYGVRY